MYINFYLRTAFNRCFSASVFDTETEREREREKLRIAKKNKQRVPYEC